MATVIQVSIVIAVMILGMSLTPGSDPVDLLGCLAKVFVLGFCGAVGFCWAGLLIEERE